MSAIIDVSKLKVNELKAELMVRGLDSKGLKSSLVERLREALEKEGNISGENESTVEDVQAVEPVQETKTVNDFSEIDKEIGNDQVANESQYLTADDGDSTGKTNNGNVSEQTVVGNDTLINDKEFEMELEAPVNNGNDKEADKVTETVTETENVVVAAVDAAVDAKDDKDQTTVDQNTNKKDYRKRRYEVDNEPQYNDEAVLLAWNDSDLNLEIHRKNFVKARPIFGQVFGYLWGSGRATYGVSKGKVFFEVEIIEKCDWKDIWISKTNTMKDVMNYGKHNRDQEKQEESQESKKAKVLEGGSAAPMDQDAENSNVVAVGETVTKTVEVRDGRSEAQIAIEKQVAQEGIDYSKDNDMTTTTITEQTPEAAADASEAAPVEEVVELTDEEKETKRVDSTTHCIRVGWSALGTNYLLGEDKLSYSYDTVGYKATNSEFVPCKIPGLKEMPEVGDKITVFLDVDETHLKMYVTYNTHEITADNLIFDVSKSEMCLEEGKEVAFYPHVSIRNLGVEMKFGGPSAEVPKTEEEIEAAKKAADEAADKPAEGNDKAADDGDVKPVEEKIVVDLVKEISGYKILGECENRVAGVKRIASREECEVILMIGMPSTGKTAWANKYSLENADKAVYILGKEQLREKMRMNGHATKIASEFQMDKCLNHLLNCASRRRRNYIIDDSSLYLRIQQNRMHPFRGYNRKAVLMIVPFEKQDEVFEQMHMNQTRVMEMKANIWVPKIGEYVEVLEFGNLPEAEAREVIEKYIKDGKEAGYSFYEKRNWQGYRRDQWSGHHNQRYPDWRYNVGPWTCPPFGYYAPRYAPRGGGMMQQGGAGYRNQRNWNNQWYGNQMGYQGWGYGQQYGNRRDNRQRNYNNQNNNRGKGGYNKSTNNTNDTAEGNAETKVEAKVEDVSMTDPTVFAVEE